MSNVALKKENGVAIISVVRPEALNALSREIVDEIWAAFEDVKADSTMRCVVLHQEKNFAAGADIKDMADCDIEGAKAFCFNPVFDKIADFELPVIAAIEGYALGGGMEYALTADIRIAGESARMGFPEVSLGIFPGAGGTIRTPKLIGAALAKEMIFSGGQFGAKWAESKGLVNKVVPDEEVLSEALKLAEKIAKRGPVAVRRVKKLINDGLALADEKAGIALESERWAGLFDTYDQKEGMHAFIEKRKPAFENR